MIEEIRKEAKDRKTSLLVYQCSDGCCTEYDDFISISDLDDILDNHTSDIDYKAMWEERKQNLLKAINSQEDDIDFVKGFLKDVSCFNTGYLDKSEEIRGKELILIFFKVELELMQQIEQTHGIRGE